MKMDSPRGTTAVCTIVSKNYLAYARTLMNSVADVHPDWVRYVLLVDEIDGYFDPSQENFQLVEVAELRLPDAEKFLYRYNLLEVNTAVKPWFLEWLFHQGSTERVVYLDPDIRVYRPLVDAQKLLSAGALMTLTPHLLDTLGDGRRPNDQDILRSGSYNLGFIALARHRELNRFLAWWQCKLEFDCRVDLDEGLFVDQKWMDLAPGLFSDVAILRHPGYNVAYWNLPHRPVHFANGEPRVADHPLVFFHFSGLDPKSPGEFSKHQDRYRLANIGESGKLVKAYCRAVLDNGWETCKNWPYAFGVLNDATPIAASMRRYYRRRPDAIRRAGSNPFLHSHDYLNEPWDGARQPLVTRLMRAIWENRPDLRDAFPELQRHWREEYASHFVEFVARQEGISEAFVSPVCDSLRLWRSSTRTADATERVGFAFPPPQCDDEDHPAGWMIRLLARMALTVVPVPREPERLLGYYRLLRPMRHFVPSAIRRQLKRDIGFWIHRKRSLRRSLGLTEMILAIGRWLRRLLPLAPANADPAKSATTAPPALDVESHEHHSLRVPKPRNAMADGINIVGHLSANTGVGESARLCAQAALASRMPFSLHNVAALREGERLDPRWIGHLAEDNRHPVNVFHINADQISFIRDTLGNSFFANRHNIGVWHWELPKFPDRWLNAFDLVDEIWAPSRFIQDTLAARSPRPVVRIPHAIRFEENRRATRAAFGLPADDLLFLMMYDVRSYQQRKNPEGAIEAFRRAFADTRDVMLVVKVNDARRHPQELANLKQTLRGVSNVRVLEEAMDRQTTYDLQSVCDCMVSLHRAEGFGLVLAEAMFLGKPVIATGWSGNMEFMNRDNSCPVDYRLVHLDRDIGPYERGQIWAEPDLDHAAEFMQKIASENLWRQKIGLAGRATIANDFSPERIGELYRQRLDVILNRRPQAFSAARFAA